jgi:pyruvate,water dikinase
MTTIAARSAEVREQVPADHQDEFDELLGEARLLYRLRDERGVYSDIWACGIMRRAALGAGRRAAATGRIDEPEHMLDAGLDEMQYLVRGTGGPSADELAARAAYRTSHTAKDAPTTLGPPAPPPPDPSGLPPGVGRLMQATGIALGALFGSSEAEHEEAMLRGLAASTGVYEGTARLIESPTEFGRIVKGDVLVTSRRPRRSTSCSRSSARSSPTAAVSSSHSAIVAREYGIPGVVGTREATSRILDGARVRVDGNAGEVTVLA